MKHHLILLLFLSMSNLSQGQEALLDNIKTELGRNSGFFAMAFRNVGTGETLLLNAQESFHAASTMKTPVMIEVYKQAAAGKFSLTDSVLIRNDFLSIVDSSRYQLNVTDDSQQDLYTRIGKKTTIYDLVYQMIILSSNLATNILIEMVDGKKVTQTMRELGAMDIQVLRGVEDSKAFAKGLNNTTTAYDLMLVFDKLARSEVVDAGSSREMINILHNQQYREIIPARLPQGVKVAHKTGSITALQHDSGIVYLPDGRKYVLVLLSRKLENEKAAIESMAKVSEMVYKYVWEKR